MYVDSYESLFIDSYESRSRSIYIQTLHVDSYESLFIDSYESRSRWHVPRANVLKKSVVKAAGQTNERIPLKLGMSIAKLSGHVPLGNERWRPAFDRSGEFVEGNLMLLTSGLLMTSQGGSK